MVLAIDNTRIRLSMTGRKIFKISDRNTIGLALIMDVIKAGSAILINLSHCQRVEIAEASYGTTTESFSRQHHLEKDTHTNTHTLDAQTKTSELRHSTVKFVEKFTARHSLTENTK